LHLAHHHPGRQLTRRAVGRREDETRGSATVLLVGASVASLLGVGFALNPCGAAQRYTSGVARRRRGANCFDGGQRGLHAARRRPDLWIGPEGPTYRDFAHVAFRIGMCCQVSETTVRDRRIRRTVLSHALLCYLFGAAIVGASVNLIASLIC
jgi:uncharacterized membrane protein